MAEPGSKIRIDKWLWQARFFKTRSLAAREVGAGHCRVNSARITKPAYQLSIGEVLTFPQARIVRVVRVVELGTRRGPAPEAQALYEDLTEYPDPTDPRDNLPGVPRFEGRGRPTKKDRRKLDLKRASTLD